MKRKTLIIAAGVVGVLGFGSVMWRGDFETLCKVERRVCRSSSGCPCGQTLRLYFSGLTSPLPNENGVVWRRFRERIEDSEQW
jgi:hypothetical protein